MYIMNIMEDKMDELKNINNIWFGLVEIKPLNDNTIIEDTLGAYVNVAYTANTKNEFIEKVKNSFFENDYQVLEIDDIENILDFKIDKPDNAEKVDLFNIVDEDYDFSWSIFHTYSEE